MKPRTRRDGSNYARGAAAGTGYRNGYRRGRLKTAKGVVDYAAPQICDRAFRFARDCARSSVAERRSWRRWRWRCMRAGCRHATSKRLFADEDGRSLLSRTAVSEVTERLWAQYEAFASRDLSEFEVIYLFVDGIAERLHLGQPREAVLAAWGVLADGHRVLLHLAPGSKEDTASCREFFLDMRRRGLPDPLLVISDGAPGPRSRMLPALRGNAVSSTSCAICRARGRRINGRSSRRAPLPATRPPRRRSPACCGTTLRRPTAPPCRQR